MGQVFSEYFSCCLSVWSHQWPTFTDACQCDPTNGPHSLLPVSVIPPVAHIHCCLSVWSHQWPTFTVTCQCDPTNGPHSLLPVSVIPQVAHIHLHLNTTIVRRTSGQSWQTFKPSNALFSGQKVLSNCFCSGFKELMNVLVPGYWKAVYLFELRWIFRCKMPCEEFHWQHGYLLIGLKVRFDSITANTAHHWQQRCEEWIKCLMVTEGEERTLVLQSCI